MGTKGDWWTLVEVCALLGVILVLLLNYCIDFAASDDN